MKKLKFGSKEFKKRLVNSFLDASNITVCSDCGSPIESGYVCGYCGSDDPSKDDLDYSDMLDQVVWEIKESV